jgi:phosphomevalonate kinase
VGLYLVAVIVWGLLLVGPGLEYWACSIGYRQSTGLGSSSTLVLGLIVVGVILC